MHLIRPQSNELRWPSKLMQTKHIKFTTKNLVEFSTSRDALETETFRKLVFEYR